MPIQKNISLKNKNTLGIDCEAEFFIEVTNEENLLEAISFLQKNKLTPFILGIGSNILLPQKLPGLTIVLKHQQFILGDSTVTLGSGNLLTQDITRLAKESFDLSALTGFPSTIGGAVRGNAGLLGVSIGDFLVEAVIYDLQTGKKEIWKQADFEFGYRDSKLKQLPHKIFWEGVFEFPKADNVPEKVKTLLQERWSKQPQGKSAGCFFKNPEGDSAGRLIDTCGLKGKQIGGAQISEKHANFFINKGDATTEDFLDLINFTKKAVKEKFGTDLELEVQIIQ